MRLPRDFALINSWLVSEDTYVAFGKIGPGFNVEIHGYLLSSIEIPSPAVLSHWKRGGAIETFPATFGATQGEKRP